jgi:NAD+ synthase
MATPGRVVGLIMPCHSDPRDEEDAELIVHRFTVPGVRVDLTPAYDLLVADLKTLFLQLPVDQAPERAATETADIRARVPFANIKPRLRMATLYFVANSLNYLVAGTGNRSELTIGYFTKYGDGGVDVLPLGQLTKGDVLALARELEVPESIIDKAPSAELRPNQKDQDSLPPYPILDEVLTGMIEDELSVAEIVENGHGRFDRELVKRVERLVLLAEYKRRQAAPGVKLTRKAFGIGRKYPITNGYRDDSDIVVREQRLAPQGVE